MSAPTFDPEFDHVYVIDAQGNIQMDSPLFAPDVENGPDADTDVIVSTGWSVLTGHTGQHGYRGAVMHPSELWGAWAIDDLTERAQDGPVAFAIVEVRDTDGSFPEGDPIGWAVAYRVLTTEPEHVTPAQGSTVMTPQGRGMMAGVTGSRYAVEMEASGALIGFDPSEVRPSMQRTPEQIADDIAALPEFASLTDEDLGRSVEAMIVRGIEADRAQRRTSFDEIDHMLNAWENFDGDVPGFIQAWVDHLNDGDDLPDWATA
jgi:hypothetical protein